MSWTVLFDPDVPLSERIIAEQFTAWVGTLLKQGPRGTPEAWQPPLPGRGRFVSVSSRAAAEHGVVDREDDDGADDGDDHARDVEAALPWRAGEERDEVAADYGAHDAKDDVENRPSPCLFTILLAMKPAISPNTTQPMMLTA